MFLRTPNAQALRKKTKSCLARVRTFIEFSRAVPYLQTFATSNVIPRTENGYLLPYSGDYLDAVEQTVISKMYFLQYGAPPESSRYLVFKGITHLMWVRGLY